MPDLIATDHSLTEPERELLAALLDTLIPASDDGEMPSAAEVGFERHLFEQAEAFVPQLQEILQQFEPAFADMPIAERCARVSEYSANDPTTFQGLLAQVYDCYYQHDRVREQIGIATGAPFPQGNQVAPGDLSLLDPVVERGARHRYRDA